MKRIIILTLIFLVSGVVCQNKKAKAQEPMITRFVFNIGTNWYSAPVTNMSTDFGAHDNDGNFRSVGTLTENGKFTLSLPGRAKAYSGSYEVKPTKVPGKLSAVVNDWDNDQQDQGLRQVHPEMLWAASNDPLNLWAFGNSIRIFIAPSAERAMQKIGLDLRLGIGEGTAVLAFSTGKKINLVQAYSGSLFFEEEKGSVLMHWNNAGHETVYELRKDGSMKVRGPG